MKRTTDLFCLIVIVVTFFSNTAIVLAQEESIEVKELRVPISPAINLLGVAPVEVAQPTAPKAFGLTVLESATNSQGDFPNNFALEFAPYWWFSHPNLSFEEYYEKTGFGQAILQNLSFSVGTTSTTIVNGDEEVEGSRIGFGARTSLLAGNKNPLMDRKIQEYLDLASRCKRELQDLNPELDVTDTEPIESGAEILPDCSVQDEKIAKLEEIENLGLDRVGWQLDAANAYIFDSPDNNIDELDLSRIGVWLTASYRSVSIDRVVEKVTAKTCDAEIESIFKNLTGTNSNFSDRDIDAAVSGYDCIRSPHANKIIFFDRQPENTVAGNCKIEDFKEYNASGNREGITQESIKKYTCVERSGLSVLKIIDNPAKVVAATAKKNKEIDTCRANYPQDYARLQNIPNLKPSDRTNELRDGSKDINQTDLFAVNVNEPSKQYQCATLTLPATSEATSKPTIKSVLINKPTAVKLASPVLDSGLKERGDKNHQCNILLDDFLKKNNLQDRDRYTCAKFSLPSVTVAIDPTAAEDVDEECAAKIEREKTEEDALKFLKYQCVYKPDRFSFLGIGRYIRDEFSGEEEDNFDLGTRVIWHPAIDSKLQLSAEYLRRFGGVGDDRLVGGIRYKINDTYELFSAVGKAFDDGFDGDNLITILGINIGLGKNTLPAPPVPGN